MNLLPAAELLKLQRPLVIAHRGYSAFAPENSIPAFEMACEAGVDFVEFDTRNSSDDVPFVLHDELLDRTTDVYARWGKRRLKIRDCESKRLKELKNGLWHAPPHPGARLPTVESAARSILKGSA
ncbi:MAG: hypothetical protein FJ405_14745, partial [Verrucomicrobia bacterium]|nr:hypothetical protein [Verrucomicrobiota bacterium]